MEVDWKKVAKEEQLKSMEREIDKYILYSFNKNFALN